ncbi:hypothetical protein ACLMJK_004383 [Lecanora helva]
MVHPHRLPTDMDEIPDTIEDGTAHLHRRGGLHHQEDMTGAHRQEIQEIAIWIPIAHAHTRDRGLDQGLSLLALGHIVLREGVKVIDAEVQHLQ